MRLYQEALEIDERLGDLQRQSRHAARDGLRATSLRGDLDGAMRLYQEALEIFERLGDLRGKGATLHEMAYILRLRGDLDGAMRLYQEALEIFERLGDLLWKGDYAARDGLHPAPARRSGRGDAALSGGARNL
jgi:tetratricopeptide (TPR) repeat protein